MPAFFAPRAMGSRVHFYTRGRKLLTKRALWCKIFMYAEVQRVFSAPSGFAVFFCEIAKAFFRAFPD